MLMTPTMHSPVRIPFTYFSSQVEAAPSSEETEETTKKKAKAKKDTETVKRARGGRTIDF